MGKFIVIEGLDGSGKSTQIELLANALKDKGEAVHATAEPSEGYIGRYLREILSESVETDMHFQAALFLADRIDHITNKNDGIKKYLDNGYTVICDRYYYSSFAYQGTATDMDWVMDMNLGCDKIIKPDVCIFLDVDPATCKGRIDSTREKAELYERDVELMAEVRENFLSALGRLKNDENIYIVDANRDVDEVAKEIMRYV